MDKKETKEKIEALIKFYNSKKEEFNKLNETDIRIKLIDRLFGLLGWDLKGEERPEEVIREETIEGKESHKKKADYVCRIGGVPKLVIEAKSIKAKIDNEDYQKQVIGYSFNLACSWAILTNFIETKIYFVDRDDNTIVLAIKDLSDINEFENNFEKLWFLSRESAKEDLLGKDLENRGIKPKKAKVDKQLYNDLKIWRKKLSDEIKKNYSKYYNSSDIEEIIQRIIDRLIFIRKLEDMELEERKLYQLTRRFSSETKYYKELKKIFMYYREKYNSGLFGEKEEQECDRIDVSNNIIEYIIKGMYKPADRKIEYNFAVIDADVLGNIYEQYLSFILKETPKRTKLEGGVAHRKEQGIYYTPTYIVDYIVKNSVSNYIKNKNIDDILETKILDIACGSGSFLIKAFSEVCRIVEEKLKKKEFSKNAGGFTNYNGKLNLAQKVTILIRCIYGVDLDKKAVEIAQLNLLLKLLEGETSESLSRIKQTKKLLPMLNTNIKCGNSLVNDSRTDERAFKWDEEFGYKFDIIIGNPPYERTLYLKKEKEFYSKNFVSAYGSYDILILFIEKAIKLLKERGNLGYIVSNKFLVSDYGKKIREFLLENTKIKKVIDLADAKRVFPDALVSTAILILEKTKTKDYSIEVFVADKETESFNEKGFQTIPLNKFISGDGSFNIRFDSKKNTIYEKIDNLEKFGDKLKVRTGVMGFEYWKMKPFIHDGKKSNKDIRIVTNSHLDQYSFLWGKEIRLYKEKYREPYSNINKIDVNKQTKDLFLTKNKIIIRGVAKRLTAMLDEEGVGFLVAVHSVLTNEDYNSKIILAILNSSFFNWIHKERFYLGRIPEGSLKYPISFIKNLPLPKKITNEKEIIKEVDEIISLNKKLKELKDKKTDEKFVLDNKINKIKEDIDNLVYKLYEITDKEKDIIEKS